MKSPLRKLALSIVVLVFGLLFSGCNLLELKNKAGLQVITDDKPVSIFIDDHYLGVSPFITKDLKPGEYTIRIEPNDTSLATYETTINLRKGLLSVLTWKPGPTPGQSGGIIYELEKLPNNKRTELSVITIPDSAFVSIDGGEKLFTPFIETEIEQGNHEFEISLPSYDAQLHTINILKGYRLNVLVKLAKESDSDELARMEEPEQILGTVQESSDAALINNPLDPSDVKATPSAQPTQAVRQPNQSATVTGPSVLIKSTNFYQNEQEVLRVREASTSAATTIGYALSGSEYPYGGEKTNGWIQIIFNGQSGWVSSQYAQVKE